MGKLTDSSKDRIDKMTREELSFEINKGPRSIFQGDTFAYLKSRIELLDKEAESAFQKKSIEAAEGANRNQLKWVKIGLITSVAINIIQVVIQYFSKC